LFQRLAKESSATLSLAWPVVIGQLSYMGMQMIDVAMVGHLGNLALGGMALGSAVSSVGFIICLGILLAILPLVAQAEGEASGAVFGQGVVTGDAGEGLARAQRAAISRAAISRAKAGRVLVQGLWLSVGLAIVYIAVLSQVGALLELTGQQPELIAAAVVYVDPLLWGFPAVLAFMAARQFVEGLSWTRPAMVISLISLPLNGLLNYILMYGHLGAPQLGIAGTAWATSILHWCGLVALIGFIWRAKRFAPYQIRRALGGPDWKELKTLLRLGIPSGVALGMEVGVFAGGGLLMGWFGPTAMAAHQSAMNLVSTSFMMPLGVSSAGSIRVGQARGRGDWHAIRWAAATAWLIVLLIMVITATLLLTIPDLLMAIYTDEPETIALGSRLLFIGAVFQLFDGVQVTGIGILRGLKDTKIPMYATIFAYWMVGLPCAYLLAYGLAWGPVGVWWGYVAGLGAAAVCHTLRFRHLLRQAQRWPSR